MSPTRRGLAWSLVGVSWTKSIEPPRAPIPPEPTSSVAHEGMEVPARRMRSNPPTKFRYMRSGDLPGGAGAPNETGLGIGSTAVYEGPRATSTGGAVALTAGPGVLNLTRPSGGVAQLVEQGNHNPLVRGSNPCAATIFTP